MWFYSQSTIVPLVPVTNYNITPIAVGCVKCAMVRTIHIPGLLLTQQNKSKSVQKNENKQNTRTLVAKERKTWEIKKIIYLSVHALDLSTQTQEGKEREKKRQMSNRLQTKHASVISLLTERKKYKYGTRAERRQICKKLKFKHVILNTVYAEKKKFHVKQKTNHVASNSWFLGRVCSSNYQPQHLQVQLQKVIPLLSLI